MNGTFTSYAAVLMMPAGQTVQQQATQSVAEGAPVLGEREWREQEKNGGGAAA